MFSADNAQLLFRLMKTVNAFANGDIKMNFTPMISVLRGAQD